MGGFIYFFDCIWSDLFEEIIFFPFFIKEFFLRFSSVLLVYRWEWRVRVVGALKILCMGGYRLAVRGGVVGGVVGV